MPYGYTGKILRVDLSSGKLTTEEYQENFYRQYFGGEGFISYFMLKELINSIQASCWPMNSVKSPEFFAAINCLLSDVTKRSARHSNAQAT